MWQYTSNEPFSFPSIPVGLPIRARFPKGGPNSGPGAFGDVIKVNVRQIRHQDIGDDVIIGRVSVKLAQELWNGKRGRESEGMV